MIVKRITRSVIIININTKSVKLVKTNISSLLSKTYLQSECKDEMLVPILHLWYYFHNDYASGYSLYNCNISFSDMPIFSLSAKKVTSSAQKFEK